MFLLVWKEYYYYENPMSYFGIAGIRLGDNNILEDFVVDSTLSVLKTVFNDEKHFKGFIDLVRKLEEGFEGRTFSFIYYMPWDVAEIQISTPDYYLLTMDIIATDLDYVNDLKKYKDLRDKILDIMALPVDPREMFKALKELYPIMNKAIKGDVFRVGFSYTDKGFTKDVPALEIKIGRLQFGIKSEDDTFINRALETLNLPRDLRKTLNHLQNLNPDNYKIEFSWDMYDLGEKVF